MALRSRCGTGFGPAASTTSKHQQLRQEQENYVSAGQELKHTDTRSAQSGLAPILEALFPMGHLIIGIAILALSACLYSICCVSVCSFYRDLT